MTEIKQSNNQPINRLRSILKTKIAKILILLLVILFLLGLVVFYLYLNKKNTDVVKYRNVNDALTSNMSPKQSNDYKQYTKLLSDYNSGYYQSTIDDAKKSLDSSLSDELVSSYYYLIINSYVKLGDVKSAEATVKQFKSTDSYKNLDQEAKRILDQSLTPASTVNTSN